MAFYEGGSWQAAGRAALLPHVAWGTWDAALHGERPVRAQRLPKVAPLPSRLLQ